MPFKCEIILSLRNLLADPETVDGLALTLKLSDKRILVVPAKNKE